VNCRDFVDFLMDYIEGTLAAPERQTFDAHMDECPSCIRYLDTYRETVRLGQALCDDLDGPVPAEAPEALVQAILAARTAKRKGDVG
jgi:anti-sigma factor RsiW